MSVPESISQVSACLKAGLTSTTGKEVSIDEDNYFLSVLEKKKRDDGNLLPQASIRSSSAEPALLVASGTPA